MTRRKSMPKGDPGAAEPVTPVVVTFDASGALLDVVGGVETFVAPPDTVESVLQRLWDLRGDMRHERERLLPAIELSGDRFADVHIVMEGDDCHFVLLDNSRMMRLLRMSQQASNELALQQSLMRRIVLRKSRRRQPADRSVDVATEPFRWDMELLAAVMSEFRGSLAALVGNAHALTPHCRSKPEAMQALSSILDAAVHLESTVFSGLAGLGGFAAVGGEDGWLDLSQVAATLQRAFALPAQMRGQTFEVRLGTRSGTMALDGTDLRLLLVNLLVHALDGASGGHITVALREAHGALEVEIGSAPHGFSEDHFGALVTMPNLLHAVTDGSFGMAIAQQVLKRMGARAEIVPLVAGGYELWIRIPEAAMASVSTGT